MTRVSTRNLADLRFPEVARLITNRSVIIQPIGAIEQHGPHLPLATDWIIAAHTAAATVEALNEDLDVWLLPPIAYSKSEEHHWAPGTISLTEESFRGVVRDVSRSVAKTAARRIVFHNGHGGNSAMLGSLLRDVRLDTGLMTFLTHPSLPADQGGTADDGTSELGMGIHAGFAETSMMLYLRPDLVSMADVVRNVPEWLATNEHVRFGGSARFGWLSNDFGPSGVIGDPTGANAPAGRAMFEASVAEFAATLEEISRFSFSAGR